MKHQDTKNKKMRWKRYLSAEIGIEYKACLYFFAILFFYGVYRVINGAYNASLVHLTEMILTTYAMGYLQVYGLQNFDEADAWGKREIGSMLLCTILYVAISYLCGWFDKKMTAEAAFAGYIIFGMVCMFFVNKVKRDIDTQMLNEMLEQYKERGESHEICDRDGKSEEVLRQETRD